MKSMLQLPLLLLICLAPAYLHGQGPPDLAKQQSTYENLKKNYQAERAAKEKELTDRYKTVLNRIAAQYAEQDRLQEALAATEAATEATTGAALSARALPDNVKTARQGYLEAKTKIGDDFGMRMKQLNEAYAKSLDGLIVQLTKANRMDEAIKAREAKLAVEAEIQNLASASPAALAPAPAPVPALPGVMNPNLAVPGIPFETALLATAKEQVMAVLEPELQAHRGAKGTVYYSFKNDLPHEIGRFPSERRRYPNRDYVIPPLPFEPRGSILAPEYRTLESHLTLTVEGSAVITVYQGMYVAHTLDAEKLMKTWYALGWKIVAKNWDKPSGPLDAAFAMSRVVTDETIEFPGQGNWGQLPTIIVSDLPQGSVNLREKKTPKAP